MGVNKITPVFNLLLQFNTVSHINIFKNRCFLLFLGKESIRALLNTTQCCAIIRRNADTSFHIFP